jgi:hypothetical protein
MAAETHSPPAPLRPYSNADFGRTRAIADEGIVLHGHESHAQNSPALSFL